MCSISKLSLYLSLKKKFGSHLNDEGLCELGLSVASRPPGPRLNIKTVLSTYGDFHVKDKTAVRTSYL